MENSRSYSSALIGSELTFGTQYLDQRQFGSSEFQFGLFFDLSCHLRNIASFGSLRIGISRTSPRGVCDVGLATNPISDQLLQALAGMERHQLVWLVAAVAASFIAGVGSFWLEVLTRERAEVFNGFRHFGWPICWKLLPTTGWRHLRCRGSVLKL